MPGTSTKPALKIAAGARKSDHRLDDQVGFQLRRAYQRASANLAAQLAAYDLTPPQFSILARPPVRCATTIVPSNEAS